MRLFGRMDRWAQAHHPRWIDALRIISGLIIHAKALLFIGITAEWIRVLESYGLGKSAKLLVYTIGVVNLLSGTFIIIGFQTRLFALIQIPVIIISLIYSFDHMRGPLFNADVLLSVLILFLLVFFFVEGSGKFSVDQYLRNSYKTYQANRKQP